jgi:hypothetical protein
VIVRRISVAVNRVAVNFAAVDCAVRNARASQR